MPTDEPDEKAREWPDHLYKYRPLTNDEDMKRAKSILDGHLYAASRRDFNDPYDCAPVLGMKADAALRASLLRASAASDPEMSRQDRRRMAARTMKVAEKRGAPALFKQPIDNYIDSVGIISLAEEPDNLLMWGHYGSQHTGICFRFSVYKWPPRERPYPVAYRDARPVFSEPSLELLDIIFLRKATCWSYEMEWRVVDRTGPGLKAYGPETLDAIIFGARVRPEHRAEIIRYVQAKQRAPVEFLQARLDERNYDIGIKPLANRASGGAPRSGRAPRPLRPS